MIFFLYVDLIKMSLAPGKQNYPIWTSSPWKTLLDPNIIVRLIKFNGWYMINSSQPPTPHPNHTPIVGNEMIQVRWGGGFISQWLFDSFHIIFSACHHFRYRVKFAPISKVLSLKYNTSCVWLLKFPSCMYFWCLLGTLPCEI